MKARGSVLLRDMFLSTYYLPLSDYSTIVEL